MARRADSTIRVNIIGDARSLSSALDQGEKGVGKFSGVLKGIGTAIVAGFAADAVFDFAQSALNEADRLGDATTRLQEQLGKLADPLIAGSEGFTKLGQSSQDILELEARLADIATAAGIADPIIADLADDAAATAAALSLLTGTDAATIIDQIGKAAGGSDRPLKELGISLSDAEVEARAMADTGKANAEALSDGELAAARLELILEKLAPRVAEVTGGEGDLEQKQSELTAKWETFTGKVGAALEGPLTDVLDWILSGIDGLSHLSEGIIVVAREFGKALQPIKAFGDSLGDIIDMLSDPTGIFDAVGGFVSGGPHLAHPPSAPSGPFSPDLQSSAFVIQVQGGSPEEIERAVMSAVDRLERRGTSVGPGV